jgi:hypothetical protein
MTNRGDRIIASVKHHNITGCFSETDDTLHGTPI